MATNYQRGANLEYKVRRQFEEAGYYVVRSAGSRGVADLVAVKQGQVFWIQVKKSTSTAKEKEKLEELVEKYGGYGIWATSQYRGVQYEIYFEGEWEPWQLR